MVNECIPIIGMLMLLESPYAVEVDRPISTNPSDRQYFGKYLQWRMLRFVPRTILYTGGFEIDDVKRVYDHLARSGHLEDPLVHWYTLIELTKRSMKQMMRGSALLSQNYYELAKMIQAFARDLDLQLPDPDDYSNGFGGKWKPKIYGEPFEYRSSRMQMRIRDRFFKD